MLVDVEVALGFDFEIEETMARETIQHVIEEGNAGGDLAASAAVELERDLHRGLAGLAVDVCDALAIVGMERRHQRAAFLMRPVGSLDVASRGTRCGPNFGFLF